MNEGTSVTGNLMQTPGVHQFIGDAAEKLVAGRTVLSPLPATVEPSAVWRALKRQLQEADLLAVQVSMQTLPTGVSPAYALADFLQIPWKAEGVAALACSDGLPGVLSLSGFEHLADTQQALWIDFLVQWTHQSRSINQSGGDPTALCLLSPAEALLPYLPSAGDLFLSIQWWWGIPTLLDFRLRCRLGSAVGDDAAHWRERLLPELVSGDDTLTDYLWDLCDQNFDGIFSALKDYASSRGWSPAVLHSWGAERFQQDRRPEYIFHIEPPVDLRDLWSAGALHWTPEYGSELHSAALAALDLDAHLQHRLWRGQMALVLPLLDQARLTLCEALTRRHGLDWPVRWICPENEQDKQRVTANSLACDLGHILYLLHKVPELSGERTLLPFAREISRLRNELAHYRLVCYSDFIYLRSGLSQISRS